MPHMQAYSDEERTMAALAHAGILLGLFTSGLGGILIGVLIWLVKRDESRWVGFQALQAVVYQLLGIAIIFLSFMCWIALLFSSLIPVMMNPEQYAEAPPPIFFISFGLLCIPFALFALWTLYGLWGALQTWRGQDFRYFWIGNALARWSGLADHGTHG